MLTIRDIQSQEQFSVPPEGAVLGREGGGADIVVRDKSVSKRHAKVYERGGKWFLEDLQSANGTYVDEQPVTRPINVRAGMSFSLSNYHFEIVGFEAGGSSAPTKARTAPPPSANDWEADGGFADQTEPPPEEDDEWGAPAPSKGNRAPLAGGGSKSGKSASGSSARPAGGNKTGAVDRPKKSTGGGGARVDTSGDAGGVGAQIPKALAHYLKNVPLLLFNPIGFVKGSIEDMKWPGMKPMELLPWGLVAAVINIAVGIGGGALGTVVGMIRSKSFSVDAIIGLVTGSVAMIVIGLVVAIVSAFIFHPVMGFIIRILKGESDETSRSNYYICVMTGYVLMALPAAATGLSQTLSLIPVAGGYLAGIAPILGGVIGQAYLLVIAFFWLRFFQVMKFVPILCIIGAIAVTALGALGIVGVLTGGGAAGATLTAEQAAALAAQAGMTPLPDGSMPTPAVPDATPDEDPGTTPTPGAASTAGAATPAPTATAVAMATAGKATPVPTTGGNTNTATVKPPAGQYNTPYLRFVAKRDAVEKAIADDPMMLERDPTLLAAYRDYHQKAFLAKQKYAKQNTPAMATVTQRLIDAETFRTTGQIVDQLYAKVTAK